MKLFTMAAWAFILWILQGLVFHQCWRKSLNVSLSFSCAGTEEGSRAVLKETITNAKALPLPVLHVKFQMAKYLIFTSSGNFKITDQNYRSDIFSCMPWQEIRRNLEFSCSKRGYYTISQVQLISYDLFFSSRLAASLPVNACLYVYPREVPPERLNLPFRNLCGQFLARSSLLADPFEIQSVRPYQSYDPYRAINWKATARTGELKVNVYAPTASWQVMFLLDMDSGGIYKDEALTEEAIRLCASYSRLLIRQGIPVSVCTNGTDCLTGQPGCIKSGAGPGHVKAVVELLARIQAAEKLPPIELFLETMADGSCTFAPWGRESVIYILISSKQRESLAESYGSLCRSVPGCQWILPLRPGQKCCLKPSAQFSLFPWEVAYDYSQAS